MKMVKERMVYKLFNVNAGYYTNNGVYSLETQFEMTKALGFEGIFLALWTSQAYDELDQLSKLSKKYGVEVTTVYAVIELGKNDAKNEHVLQMLETLEGCSTVTLAMMTVAPNLRPSDASGDEVAVHWLKQALEIAERRNISLVLYPHLSYWMETYLDAVRVIQQINHSNLGIHFSSYHWYAVSGLDVTDILEMVAPYLKQVTLAGSTKDPNGFGGVATILPLDEGKLDNFVILGQLKKIGFKGEIGFLNSDWGGDLYSKLERSIKVFREMEQRIETYPHWAELEHPY